MVRGLNGDLPSRTWPIRQKLIQHLQHFIAGPVMLFKDVDDLLASHFAGFLVTMLILLTLFDGRICCSWVAARYPDITI